MLPLGSDHATVPIDGRRARRHRSRDLAVEALLDLLNEGVPSPTAQQVAERSGVSLRSIFRIFEDVPGLHAAAAAHQMARAGHLFVDLSTTGDLSARARSTAASLARLYEVVGPIRRAASRVATESPTIRQNLELAYGWLRHQIHRVFGAELSRLPDAELRFAALEASLSFETWDQLRSVQGLPPAKARAVVAATVLALLA